MQRTAVITLVATVAIAALAAVNGFIAIDLDKLSGGEVGTLFLTLIFTALVIERAVEVYINNRFTATELSLNKDIRLVVTSTTSQTLLLPCLSILQHEEDCLQHQLHCLDLHQNPEM